MARDNAWKNAHHQKGFRPSLNGVGGTEANIAQAFREAQRKDAVLLIDEADSFLQDRTRSTRSWETTQVNKMLTQMERFDGTFIATTNLMDTLDPAALQRFDLKAKFGFLRKEQRLSLFARWRKTLQLAADVEAESRVAALSNLTPGDFAAATRQSQFNPLKSAADLAARLAAECRLKEENTGRGSVIGFC